MAVEAVIVHVNRPAEMEILPPFHPPRHPLIHPLRHLRRHPQRHQNLSPNATVVLVMALKTATLAIAMVKVKVVGAVQEKTERSNVKIRLFRRYPAQGMIVFDIKLGKYNFIMWWLPKDYQSFSPDGTYHDVHDFATMTIEMRWAQYRRIQIGVQIINEHEFRLPSNF
jgi:hypothetical protein